ncbi:MAG: iron ABC transporter permease [Propionibacteriaceae bacterium]|jgi:iron(III) transport system permease protein|nr:iron ABC transporter permease [Propionibacteriaceae bacterium]
MSDARLTSSTRRASGRRLSGVTIGAKARKDRFVWVVLAVVVLAIILLHGLPVSKLVGAGLSRDGLAAISRAFTSDLTPMWNSLLLGVLVAVVGTLIGFVMAYVQVFSSVRGKKLLHWLTLMPMISPPFAVATAMITMFGRRGILTYKLLGIEFDIYGLQGLVIVLAMTFTPLAYMNIRGMMENMDPSLFEAAKALGASELYILFRVTLPMVTPALLASFLILFVEGVADLANPLVLGGDFRVLASEIYFAVAGTGDVAAAAGLALVLLVPALGVFCVQKYWASRRTVVTITGKPTGSRRSVTDPIVMAPLLVIAGIWVLVIIALYGAIAVGGLTNILGVDNTVTWEHYEFVARLGSTAVGTTLWMTLVAAPVAALTAVLIAWLVARQFPRLGKVLDFVGMLGSAIPGTVLGLGFALAYAKPTWLFGHPILPALAGGVSVGSGAVAIIAVYVARAIPTGQQSTIAALSQVNRQIEEAATSLGAGQAATLRKVTLPLIAPAIVTAIMYGITKSMTTITAIIFITTPQTKVMTSQILDEVDAGRFGNAFAYCTVLIGLVLVVLVLASAALRLVTRHRKAES